MYLGSCSREVVKQRSEDSVIPLNVNEYHNKFSCHGLGDLEIFSPIGGTVCLHEVLTMFSCHVSTCFEVVQPDYF